MNTHHTCMNTPHTHEHITHTCTHTQTHVYTNSRTVVLLKKDFVAKTSSITCSGAMFIHSIEACFMIRTYNVASKLFLRWSLVILASHAWHVRRIPLCVQLHICITHFLQCHVTHRIPKESAVCCYKIWVTQVLKVLSLFNTNIHRKYMQVWVWLLNTYKM